MNDAKKVLIVEDDSGIADVLRLNFQDEGYDVTHAADCNLAVQLLESQHWDALILDLMLPALTGWKSAGGHAP